MIALWAAIAAILLVCGTVQNAGALSNITAPINFRQCGNQLSQEALIAVESGHAEILAAKDASDLLPRATKTILLWWHVIHDGSFTLEGGYLSVDQISSQVDRLNEWFDEWGYFFDYWGEKGTEYTAWSTWDAIAPDTDFSETMQFENSRGGSSVLNVYTMGFQRGEASGFLGAVGFPWDYQTNWKRDALMIKWNTLPDLGPPPYNKGNLMIHYVGHWLGLYHIYEGGCDYDPAGGDRVDDTPPQLDPTFGCPGFKDSCTDDDMEDQWWNPMDYGDDVCMGGFTSGQIQRVDAMYKKYRQQDLPPSGSG